MIIPLTMIFLRENDANTTNIAISSASKISNQIIDTSEIIFYKGKPSKTTIKAHFPDKISDIIISSNEIIFYIEGYKDRVHQVVFPSTINLTGNLSTFSGIHNIEIKSEGDRVSIKDI